MLYKDGVKPKQIKKFQKRLLKVMMGIIYFEPRLIYEGISGGIIGFHSRLLISVLSLMNISKILTI